MADRLRIVDLDSVRGSARIVLDLQNTNLYTVRGTLNLGGVAPSLQIAASSRPREAGRAVARTDQPRQVSATWTIKGTSEADCIGRLEDLISRIAASVDGRYLEWRPAAHQASAYMRLLGPASWDGTYDALRFAQTYSLEATINFPVELDAFGLPWDVYDDWTDNTFGEWLKITDTHALAAATPGNLIVTAATAAGNTSRWRHVGRNTPPLVNDDVILVYEADQLYDVAVIAGAVDTGNYVTLTHRETPGAGVGGELALEVIVANAIVASSVITGLGAPTNGGLYALALHRASPLTFVGTLHSNGRVNRMGSTTSILATATVPLDLGSAADLALRAGGHAGFMVTTRTGAAVPGTLVIRSFARRPYTFRPVPNLVTGLVPGARNYKLDTLPGKIDGPPADVDVRVQVADRADVNLPIPFGLLAWAPDGFENMLANPGGDEPVASAVTLGARAGNVAGATAGAVTDLDYQPMTTSAANQGVVFGWDAAFGRRSVRLEPGRPITLSVDLRSTDGAAFNIDVGVGDVDLTLGWAGATNAQKRTITTFALPASGAWVKCTVTITPQKDETLTFAILRASRAGTFAYRRAKLYRGLSTDEPNVPVRGGYRPLGRIPANAYHQFDGNTIGNNSDGSVQWTYSNTTRFFEWVIAPVAGDFPDFGRPLVLEVYAELAIPAANAVAPVLVLSSRAIDVRNAPTVYAQPYGGVGRPLVRPTAGQPQRTYKVGVITLDPRDTSRYSVRLELRDAAGTTGAGVAVLRALTFAPVHARCSLPTGRQPDSAYPMFLPAIPNGTRDELGRIVHADLSSSLEAEVSRARATTSSMSGEPVSLPAGRAAVLTVWTAGGVPDDPTSDAHAEEDLVNGSEVHVAITPRYNLAALLTG